MRLTLRTLLAYLDDTLQANEIRQIGQKVAESDAAQELIDRIKQVTRRRRLTTPPATGPNARFDANDVAEYLDNELPSDEVAELEKICLESDVHLAEIAACHQILTLVLGEPALVPPTARQRMYKLVQGRESLPRRRPGPSLVDSHPGAEAPAVADSDAEDLELTGLGGNFWLRWVLPLAGLFLILALGLTLWQILPPRPVLPERAPGNGDLVDRAKEEGKVKPEDPSAKDTEQLPVPPVEQEAGKDQGAVAELPAKEDKEKNPANPGNKEPQSEKEPLLVRTAPPSSERAPVARYIGAEGAVPSILVLKKTDNEGWQRVKKNQVLMTAEPVVSLPGYSSELVTNSGVGLLLRGHVREFSLDPLQDFLMESAVVLHKSKDVDLDFTLDRGRVYVTNRKDSGPARVRVRFGGEVWDLTLQEPGDELGLDLFKHYTRDINYRDGEEPRAELYLCLLRGEAQLRVDAYHTYKLDPPPGPALFIWDSFTKAQGPIRLDKLPPIWNKTPPETELARNMTLALKDLDLRLTDKRNLENALQDSFEKEIPWPKLLALYSLAAIDEVGKLVDFLGDEDFAHTLERNTAVFSLRRWISRNAKQGFDLYDPKNKTGVLIDKRYRTTEADIIYTLLHDFSDADRTNPDTFDLLADYLRHKRVAIAELGYWHLARLSLGVKIPPFNAAAPLEEREKVSQAIKDLVAKKKLPPPPPQPVEQPIQPMPPGMTPSTNPFVIKPRSS